MKPEPPTYPRPVPEIDFDEDPILPGTIIYTNDDEIDENKRAVKRRRVEANAKAYLRGEGLFILSAGLRGPFDAGWKNPWAPKGKKRALGIEDQPHSNKRARVPPNDLKSAQVAGVAVSTSRPAELGSVKENPFARTIRSSEPPTHDEKVESWLRRNSALPQDSFVVPTSPTPKKRSSITGSSKPAKPAWTPTKQKITVNSQDIRAPLHHGPSRVPDSFDTIVPPGNHPAESHEKLQDALHARDPSDGRHRNTSGKLVDQEPARAEQAILSLKRRSEEPPQSALSAPVHNQARNLGDHKCLPTTREADIVAEEASASLEQVRSLMEPPAPQPIRQDASESDAPPRPIIETEVKLKELDASINEQLQRKDDHLEETGHPNNNKVDVPLHSTAISELQSGKLPPSAQHKPELQTSASNMSSAALLPDVANDKKTAALISVPSNLSEQIVNDILGSATSQREQAAKNTDVQVSVPDPDVAVKEAVEQESCDLAVPRQSSLLHGEGVLPQHTNKASRGALNAQTSQTSLGGSIVRHPVSHQKAKSSKKTKKTSFAGETSFGSSHGSIKSVLKVQKMDTTDRAQKHTPPALSFSKSVDMDTSVEDRAGPAPHASPSEVRKIPKSILRSRSTHSSPAAALASAMLSPRREESSLSKMPNGDFNHSGQNGILQAEEFDLEGAMDDMGSFLSTWDEEKQKLRAMPAM